MGRAYEFTALRWPGSCKTRCSPICVLLERAEHLGATRAQNRRDAARSAADSQWLWKTAASVPATNVRNNLSKSVSNKISAYGFYHTPQFSLLFTFVPSSHAHLAIR